MLERLRALFRWAVSSPPMPYKKIPSVTRIKPSNGASKSPAFNQDVLGYTSLDFTRKVIVAVEAAI